MAFDAMGDLALLRGGLIAAFTGLRSSHELNHRLLRKLLADDSAWEEVTFNEPPMFQAAG